MSIHDEDHYVTYDEKGEERGRINDLDATKRFARQLVLDGRALEAIVYKVLPNFGLPPQTVETRICSFGTAPAAPLFPEGTPKRKCPSGLAERTLAQSAAM